MAQFLRRNGLSVAILCAALLAFSAASASAQSINRSFAELQKQVNVGQSVTVTDAGGNKVAGRIVDLSPGSLTLLVDRQPRTFAETQVQRVQQRRFDSLANGTLIGAGVGAGVGLAFVIYWLVVDPNECTGSPCWSDMLAPTILGTLTGLGIDAAIKANVTLYQSSTSPPSARFASPVLLVTRAGRGAGLTIRF
jgi:hypothetical protein